MMEVRLPLLRDAKFNKIIMINWRRTMWHFYTCNNKKKLNEITKKWNNKWKNRNDNERKENFQFIEFSVVCDWSRTVALMANQNWRPFKTIDWYQKLEILTIDNVSILKWELNSHVISRMQFCRNLCFYTLAS
jgi:hypothetical protein